MPLVECKLAVTNHERVENSLLARFKIESRDFNFPRMRIAVVRKDQIIQQIERVIVVAGQVSGETMHQNGAYHAVSPDVEHIDNIIEGKIKQSSGPAKDR